MKYLKKFCISILDPISLLISNGISKNVYTFLNKSVFIQIAIAIIITAVIFLVR